MGKLLGVENGWLQRGHWRTKIDWVELGEVVGVVIGVVVGC